MNGRSLNTLTLSLLLAISAAPSLQAREADIPVTMSDAAADTLPEARIRLGKITVTPDIVYSTLPGYLPLLLDLYRPDGKAALPLVIFLHGGSWTSGSKREAAHFADFPGVLAMLAQRGFAVASVDYRLSGEARFPAALQDIKAAIRFLRTNARNYGIDPKRVAVWGASAGAHLGAMTAFTGEDMDFDPPGMANADQSDRVQAFVGWYGPYELGSMFQQASAKPAQGESAAPVETAGPLRFFGCTADGCPPGVIAKASPVNYLDENDPPTLLLHGSADATVPPKQSVELDQRLKAAGVSSKLVIIDGVSHDWLGKDKESTAKASRQAIAETFGWLEQTLLKK